MNPVLVSCDGAAWPMDLSLGPDLVRRTLNHQGSRSNVNLRIQSPGAALLTQVDPRASDLLRLAAYVYAADQSVSRGGEADAHGDHWQRDFTLCLPVNDLAFWNQVEVVQLLSETLGHLSGDTWSFHFSQGQLEMGQTSFDLDYRNAMGTPDSVYLLSGGLDSLCAVVEAVAKQGNNPLLVSHSPAFNIESRQGRLTAALRSRFNQRWLFPLIRVAIHRAGSDASDYSQRTRSFLFSSIGSVIAHQLGLGQVSLADNGVVSLNLPINGQVIGTKASRSTHPKFLRLYNRFLQNVFPQGPQVFNPLWDRTRPETLQILRDTGSEELIAETNSCSHGRYLTKEKAHCGVCSQCIDRRYGTLAAGLESYDPPERYQVDLFRHSLKPGNDQTMAQSYIGFAREVEGLDGTGLFLRFSELYEGVDADDPDSGDVADGLTQMLKRYAAAVMQVTEEQIAIANPDLARDLLPPDCLLRLITGSNLVPAPTSSFRHSPDYRTVWLADECFPLSTNQARVVELLDVQRSIGVASLNQAYVLERLEISSQNLAQVFRGTSAWNRLVVRAEGRGVYRLNLPTH